MADGDTSAPRRVRVWFGEHLVAEYVASRAAADAYTSAMTQRFAGLLVTVDDEVSGRERPMPCERLWDTIPP